jgi:hypothetical protein
LRSSSFFWKVVGCKYIFPKFLIFIGKNPFSARFHVIVSRFFQKIVNCTHIFPKI